MPGAAENFKPAEDPFNKTPDWLGTLAGLLEECARSTATASVLPRTSERAKGGKELQARLVAAEEHTVPPISPHISAMIYISAISPQARLAAAEHTVTPISPLYLPYISPISPLYLRHICAGAPGGGGGAPEQRARQAAALPHQG